MAKQCPVMSFIIDIGNTHDTDDGYTMLLCVCVNDHHQTVASASHLQKPNITLLQQKC